MTVVMASGVFDIIHTGHIHYLEQAKSLGDKLVVVVACDNTVRRKKHEPVTPEDMRVRIVGALKPVDRAVLGKDGNIFDTVKEINPDIIVLGFDQSFKEEELDRQLKENGFDGIKIIRATKYGEDLAATRRIIRKINSMGADSETHRNC
ncbi:MAG: adenylyltransferase/cytidyltransferase family protein [Candidatus Methanomethylophilaceae archaeon]|jgi:FAD synthetase